MTDGGSAQNALGKRARLTAADVQKRMIDTARQVLITQAGGLSVSLDHINMERLIAVAGVPRSAVYRLWATKDDFILFFLTEIASAHDWLGTAAFDRNTIVLTMARFRDQLDNLETEDARHEALRELIRAVVKENYSILTKSLEWKTTLALTATIVSSPGGSHGEAVTKELAKTESRYNETMAKFYSGLASKLGYRVKKPFTYSQLATCGASVIEGLALRSMIGFEAGDEIVQLPESGGEAEEWTLAASAFLAVFESMLEVNPGYRPLPAEELANLKTLEPQQLAAEICGIELP